MNWKSLETVPLRRDEVLKAVDNDQWQEFRKSLKGTPLAERHLLLQQYLNTHASRAARIRVANYIGALRRGGLIP